jgi:hypothetical protein
VPEIYAVVIESVTVILPVVLLNTLIISPAVNVEFGTVIDPPLPTSIYLPISPVVNVYEEVLADPDSGTFVTADPVNPVEPVNPIEPVKPVVPCDPVNPIEPVKPITPCDPVKPMTPCDPVNPIGPCAPIVVSCTHCDDDPSS